ncbi:MAG: family 20 glycosylhydrolase, partial [Clostridiales bacterium]|nr:family 20 glycosylhydrolase [Clostridiales bacterium]
MHCIPQIKWSNQSSTYNVFSDFRLDADEALKSRLKRDLGFFDVSEDSDNVLSLREESTDDLTPGGFFLKIEDKLVQITSPTAQGIHHGLNALRQLHWSQKGQLLHGAAVQNPDFENRGIMLDVSRGKMATLEYLKQLASFLSDLNYNIFQLYCEDKLELKKHPLVGSVTGAYTKEQIQELDDWCRECFIVLQPCIQTYSHMHGLLSLPGYCSLSENDDMFSMAAGSEGVYSFLDDVLSETLPWFSSHTLNINMDEAFDIGTGFSKEESEKSGKGGVFLAHIRRVADIARSHGVHT